ncbi:uncharacterized protein TRIADDRAFT_60751 [Trichoplax adhaerens]|uniref:Uncharacterized protein n=1 Tax=Trichoplax adhaerens TaxID=10228 RepID=B3S8U9_TRIAD|nr:predicted protein [Trichoplax adhaerens]EDV20835.1 predicted protein [Trichoplax adhaerens]|eukprot:XP_002116776.1 predicted protein [Trichoplax adhaerens]
MYQPSSSHNLYQNGHYPYPHDDHSVKSNRLLHNYNWNRTLSQQMQPSLPSASPYYPSAMNKLNHDGTFRSIQPPPSLPTSSYIAQQQLASQPSLHSCMHGLSSNSMATGRTDNIPQSLYYPGGISEIYGFEVVLAYLSIATVAL